MALHVPSHPAHPLCSSDHARFAQVSYIPYVVSLDPSEKKTKNKLCCQAPLPPPSSPRDLLLADSVLGGRVHSDRIFGKVTGITQ